MKFFFLFLILCQSAFAAHTDTSGAMTFVNLNQKLSSYSSLTYYHYDVFNFKTKKINGEQFKAGINTAYFQFAYNYQIRPDVTLTGGFIYQRSNPDDLSTFQNEDRIFQQVTFGQRHRDFTSSHRFRFEERFIDNRSSKATYLRTRLRYQIGAKVPLRGLTIDAGEFFINSYNEFYFSTTGARNALFSDNWTYLGIGKMTKEWGSFEIGPMLQYSVVTESKDTRMHYVVMAGWSYSF